MFFFTLASGFSMLTTLRNTNPLILHLKIDKSTYLGVFTWSQGSSFKCPRPSNQCSSQYREKKDLEIRDLRSLYVKQKAKHFICIYSLFFSSSSWEIFLPRKFNPGSSLMHFLFVRPSVKGFNVALNFIVSLHRILLNCAQSICTAYSYLSIILSFSFQSADVLGAR